MAGLHRPLGSPAAKERLGETKKGSSRTLWCSWRDGRWSEEGGPRRTGLRRRRGSTAAGAPVRFGRREVARELREVEAKLMVGSARAEEEVRRWRGIKGGGAPVGFGR